MIIPASYLSQHTLNSCVEKTLGLENVSESGLGATNLWFVVEGILTLGSHCIGKLSCVSEQLLTCTQGGYRSFSESQYMHIRMQPKKIDPLFRSLFLTIICQHSGSLFPPSFHCLHYKTWSWVMLMRGLEMKSWAQTPPSHKEKGLVTIEHFFW